MLALHEGDADTLRQNHARRAGSALRGEEPDRDLGVAIFEAAP
jgi:hypothetical protein